RPRPGRRRRGAGRTGGSEALSSESGPPREQVPPGPAGGGIMNQDQALRDHLVKLLQGGGAHLRLDEAIGELPAELRGAKAPGLPHTVWQLLEHLRIAQRDILEFSRNADYTSPKWPDDYWPDNAAPPDE